MRRCHDSTYFNRLQSVSIDLALTVRQNSDDTFSYVHTDERGKIEFMSLSVLCAYLALHIPKMSLTLPSKKTFDEDDILVAACREEDSSLTQKDLRRSRP